MKIHEIETPRLILRGFTKEDALWAYRIWNDPEMGQYLPDEAKEEIDAEYLHMLEGLGEDAECCYLIPVFKDSLQRVGTCSFIIRDDKKVYDLAYCVQAALILEHLCGNRKPKLAGEASECGELLVYGETVAFRRSSIYPAV